MIVRASAPGRCGVVGNPSDIYGGVVLSCSVPARAWCEIETGVDSILPDDPTLWLAATKRFPIERGAVRWGSDVPRSSGLAGSTALLAATLACVLAARKESPDLESDEGRATFAELVRDVEKHDAGVQCGFQDAYMAVFGGLQRMKFSGKSPEDVGPLARMEGIHADLPFLLVTTGVQRLSGSVHGPVIERWLAGDESIKSAIDEITDLGRKGCAALLNEDLMTLASTMNRNQELIAGWGGSGEAIDRLVRDCMESGAMAAKLAGAGMGGTVIALSQDVELLQAKLAGLGYTQFLRPEIGPGLRYETP